jgi:hypothetical protein
MNKDLVLLLALASCLVWVVFTWIFA